MEFSYGEILFEAYSSKLAEIIKPIAMEISNSKNNLDSNSNNATSKLLQLYLRLKTFADKGTKQYGVNDSEIKNYFNWFAGAIDKWCEFSVSKSLNR
jgi:hypothetical protein